MEPLVPLTHRTWLAPSPDHGTRTGACQLDLALDDARLQGMTPAERQAVVMALARLLLEAAGAATRELGDDNA